MCGKTPPTCIESPLLKTSNDYGETLQENSIKLFLQSQTDRQIDSEPQAVHAMAYPCARENRHTDTRPHQCTDVLQGQSKTAIDGVDGTASIRVLFVSLISKL